MSLGRGPFKNQYLSLSRIRRVISFRYIRQGSEWRVRMDPKRLTTEAETCRRLAKSYEGRPEQPFLLKAAALFDDLAELHPSEHVRLHPNTQAGWRAKI